MSAGIRDPVLVAASPDLERWLLKNVAEHKPPFSVQRLSGGQSNPTYLIAGTAGNLVLRRQPTGPLLPSAHAIDREFRLLAKLHPLGFPAPQPLAFCDDASVFGSKFYVMSHIAGLTFWDGALPSISSADRGAIYVSLVDTLARLHRIDHEAIGLGDFGRSGNYMERQVERWTRQYRSSQTDVDQNMESLIAWLPHTTPAQTGTSIVHGDYRIDNALFDVESSSVRAIIDWELATIGDPLADFSYFALNWTLPADGGAGLGGLDLDALGIPSLSQITERYLNNSSQSRATSLEWYFAYNAFRIAAILQGIKQRLLSGNASGADAAQKAARVSQFAALGWQFARQCGAR
jgi:aminoglycoside phosphotransferase (APT) family kinase protein